MATKKEKEAAKAAQKIANDTIKKHGGVEVKKNTFAMDKAVEEEKKKRR